MTSSPEQLKQLEQWCRQHRRPLNMLATDYPYTNGYNDALNDVLRRIHAMQTTAHRHTPTEDAR